MILADCGTSYVKILDSSEKKLSIVATRDFLKDETKQFDAATGHLGRSRASCYKNELVCLALGTIKLTGRTNFCVVDVGGRDTKLVEYRDGKPQRLDWNMACGANTGFTLEIIAKYYNIDYSNLKPVDEHIDVTCGIFGIEKIFDAIIGGIREDTAVSMFVHGIARNVHRLTEMKSQLFLSGGLTENICFMESLAKYADVVPLGRTVLLEGLKKALEDEGAQYQSELSKKIQDKCVNQRNV